VEGELSQGRMTYRGAFDATDVVVAATVTRVEEFLLLRDASAPTEYAWQVELPERLAHARRNGGGLVFEDSQQRARLRIPKPVLVDAQGRERVARLGWDAGRLTVRFDPAGLTYPIVLDPAFESAVWEQASPEGSALAVHRHAAVFDRGRNVTVLFGGTLPGFNAYLPETYEYDGTSWSNPSMPWPMMTATPSRCCLEVPVRARALRRSSATSRGSTIPGFGTAPPGPRPVPAPARHPRRGSIMPWPMTARVGAR